MRWSCAQCAFTACYDDDSRPAPIPIARERIEPSMSLIAPLFLLLGLLAVPILLLYLLRLRRRDVQISSTLLWRRLLRDREANAPWQRLRRNLLLLIQLLILALLVFALARPYLPVPAVTAGSVVVVLDGSASMLASEEGAARFDLGRREVERIIDDLPGDSQLTLILAGSVPRVLVSGSQDRDSLRRALSQAQAMPVAADWPGALALAAGAAQGFQDGRIVLVSDGGLMGDLPPMPADIIYLPVGSAQENLAISALSSRDNPDGPQLFASVTNYGNLPQQALFNLTLDGQLFDARRIDVPTGETADLIWAVPEGSSVIGARLAEITEDHLSWDNEMWAVHEGGTTRRVLLVSDGNRFLETALSVLPGLEVYKVTPEIGLDAAGDSEFDLFVVDSAPVTPFIPGAEMLIVNPTGPSSDQGVDTDIGLSVGSVFTSTNIIRLADSPLLRFVDWSGVNVRAARKVVVPWARPLVTAEGGPLLLAGERDGGRVVILTFALQESDLPMQIAFPIVMANIMGWLDPGGSLVDTINLAPGEPARIGVDSGAEAIVVRKPDGALWTHDAGEDPLLFDETNQAGVYEIRSRNADGERSAGRFAVNLMSAGESRIAPANDVQLGARSLQTPSGDDVGQRELWPWFTILALLVLMVEWWIYHRGLRLPNRDDWFEMTKRRTIT
jgi:Ca-activated chloride channel family protein